MDAILAGESADSVCEAPLAMLPGIRITIPRTYDKNGMLVWQGAKDTFCSVLGLKSPITVPDCLAWHLFLQDRV